MAEMEGVQMSGSILPSGASLTRTGTDPVVVSCVRLGPRGRHTGSRRRLPRAHESTDVS